MTEMDERKKHLARLLHWKERLVADLTDVEAAIEKETAILTHAPREPSQEKE